MAKKRRRRRRRRKNPSMNYSLLGMAVLGAAAVAAASYAVEGTDLSQLAVGGIQAGAGIAVGAGVSMVSPGLGVGIASGGAAIGLKNVAGDLMMRTAKPAGAGLPRISRDHPSRPLQRVANIAGVRIRSGIGQPAPDDHDTDDRVKQQRNEDKRPLD